MMSRFQKFVFLAWIGATIAPGLASSQEDAAKPPKSLVNSSKYFATTTNVTEPSGLELAEVSDAIKAQVGLPDNQGVVVVSVRPDSPGAKAKFQPNDLLIAIEDEPATDVERTMKVLAQSRYDAVFAGPHVKAIKFRIIRAGKGKELELPAETQKTPIKFTLSRQVTKAGAKEGLYWIGVPVSPVDATLRSHLTALPAETGLLVNDVVPNSPAAKAGLVKNDVLVTMGGKSLKSPEVLIEQVRGSDGKPVPLDYLRVGRTFSLSITPEKHEVEVAEVGSVNAFPFIRMYVTPDFKQDANGAKVWTFDKNAPFHVQGQSMVNGINPALVAQQKALTAEVDLAVKEMNAKIAGFGSAKSIDEAIKELNAKVDEIRKAAEEIKKAAEAMKKAAEAMKKQDKD